LLSLLPPCSAIFLTAYYGCKATLLLDREPNNSNRGLHVGPQHARGRPDSRFLPIASFPALARPIWPGCSPAGRMASSLARLSRVRLGRTCLGRRLLGVGRCALAKPRILPCLPRHPCASSTSTVAAGLLMGNLGVLRGALALVLALVSNHRDRPYRGGRSSYPSRSDRHS
jgi:hypothetical protein